MNSAAKAQVRARVNSRIDLKAITPEQAIYAVLDRALLYGELEHSWWRNAAKGLGIIGGPAITLSGALYLVHAPHWAIATPLLLAMALLGALWLIDLAALADDGREARIVKTMSLALRVEIPPPKNPNAAPVGKAIPRCAPGRHSMRTEEEGIFCSVCGIADYQLETEVRA